ncbi:hypothetical protein O181_022232 [Austropuccinia psidii MF-1]|uniref:Uncharacterized protein n=1 Tax=Austropuccinia psidii MF-1 TaxID=1389203 RepID=A0A9Q3GWY2_9BASI|nr:hypothetical protein [Austropuccinia psidii MF-1]
MGFKHQSKFSVSTLTHFSSHNHTDLLQVCIEQNPSNTPQQDSPVPHMPHEQTLRQPTPGPSGTQWLEDLSHEPSQTKEPPIPGPSPSSKPPEDIPTCEPELEVAPMQSKEEPFGKQLLHFLTLPRFSSTIPSSVIVVDNTPVGAPPLPPIAAENPIASSPQCQAPLIPMMTLVRNSLTCNQH